MALAHAILRGDRLTIANVLAKSPQLANSTFAGGATRTDPTSYWLTPIEHYVYGGDTILHVAAAAYQAQVIRDLVAAGALVRARNRRGAEPLHYASDGGPTHSNWNPPAQEEAVTTLIGLGADPNAFDKSGVSALHRAVRTRCTGAVRALLAGGADPRLKNKSGSLPMDLATQMTGRGGSGLVEAKREQAEIVRLLSVKLGR
jgi:hypothetical protein